MSVRVDERVARCFTMLRGPEFAPLRGYLESLRTDKLESMAVAQTDLLIYRGQGEVAVLKDLLDRIAEAETLLKKLQPR